MNSLPAIFGGEKPFSVRHVGRYTLTIASGTNTGSVVVPAGDLGAPDLRRLLIVQAYVRTPNTSAAQSFSGMTIGGVECQRGHHVPGSGTFQRYYAARVISGGAKSIVLNLRNNVTANNTYECEVFEAYGCRASVFTSQNILQNRLDVATAGFIGGSDLTIPAGAALLGLFRHGTAAAGVTWSGATEIYDVDRTSHRTSAAINTFATRTTNVSLTATSAGAGSAMDLDGLLIYPKLAPGITGHVEAFGSLGTTPTSAILDWASGVASASATIATPPDAADCQLVIVVGGTTGIFDGALSATYNGASMGLLAVPPTLFNCHIFRLAAPPAGSFALQITRAGTTTASASTVFAYYVYGMQTTVFSSVPNNGTGTSASVSSFNTALNGCAIIALASTTGAVNMNTPSGTSFLTRDLNVSGNPDLRTNVYAMPNTAAATGLTVTSTLAASVNWAMCAVAFQPL